MTEPIRYNSAADIAALFGVQPETVVTWRTRYPGTPIPEPDAYIGPFAGWLPERDEEWREWRRSLPGRGAGGGRPKRSAER